MMGSILRKGATFAAALLASTSLALPGNAASNDNNTATPIKHVIVVVGENVSFDTLFGAYVPPRGRSINNLLSQGIIKADGTPGPNYARAVQKVGQNPGSTYTVNPTPVAPYAVLPQPYSTGSLNLATFTYAPSAPDARFAGITTNGPFPITKYVPYNSLTAFGVPATIGDPMHRFFQMWQQTGGSNAQLGLWTWVTKTTGQGGDTSGVTAADTGQGGELMGFYNMGKGDAPYFNFLAQHYAISDNYHQAIMGGTGANFFALATGDVAVYNNAGNTVPPANQIENPNPQAGTANFYTQDGYSGGSYVNCYDQSQPGVASILSVLNAKGRASNCAYGAYYLVNNYNPPYAVDGTPQALGATTYTYPPQTVPTIGEKLYANNVSFKWYTGGRDTADVTSDALYPLVRAQVAANPALAGAPSYIIDAYAVPATQPYLYNSIGDPMNASSVVQANAGLKANLKGLATLKADVTNNTLPAVSFVVPKNLSSGHPGYSIPGAYEAFLQGLISQVQSNPTLWANTAIIVTTDEGGGYFDSGYIQNVDFFGDGPRIPLLVVSPFTTAGNVDHTYHDHASILKFIERNWQISTPLSSRSRDRLPNPVRDPNNPYRPANEPAIGDLMTMFTFPAAP